MKIKSTDREKIFATDISDKGLVSKIYKEHLTFRFKKQHYFKK